MDDGRMHMAFLLFHSAVCAVIVLACLPWALAGVFKGKTYAVRFGVVHFKDRPLAYIGGLISNIGLTAVAGWFLYGDVVKFIHLLK